MKTSDVFSAARRTMGIVCWAAVAASPTYAASMEFGTVGATSTTHAVEQHNAGITIATVGLAWTQYETSDGTYNASYISQVKQKLQDYRAAGQKVVLDLGMQYTPSWVFNIPNSRYVNQYGDVYTPTQTGAGGANAVFNQSVRDQQAAYVKRVFSDLGTDFYATRLGWGYYGELNFPAKDYNSHTNSYWGYDVLAQGGWVAGVNRPASIPACPVPGWKPGNLSTNHSDARAVANWYMDSLEDYQSWQVATVREAYQGKLAVLYPSWGIRPGQLESAITHDLNGTTSAEKNGEIQRGFDFARLVAGITDPNVVPYTTWLDANPVGTDDTSSDPTKWSPVHYLASLASSQQLALWGENTGRNDLAAMQLSFQRAQDYGLIGLNWAFEDDLYSGQYASLADYSNLISTVPEPTSIGLMAIGSLLLARRARQHL